MPRTCKSCHGDNMTGRGIAPSVVNAGQRITFDDFKTLITVGRGQMPGLVHVEEQKLTALYPLFRWYYFKIWFWRQENYRNENA